MKKYSVAFLAALILVSCGERSGTPPDAGRRNESTRAGVDPLENSLRQTASNLVEALRSGDTEMFLRLCSRKGVAIGADGWTTFEALRDGLRQRRDCYCHYFDTTCLQKALREIRHKPSEDIKGILPMPVSYRQALNSVVGTEILQRVSTSQSGEIYGSVTVKWKSPAPRDLGFTDFIRFEFAQENGEWRLVANDFF